MNTSIFDAYAKAYEVAFFGRGKNERTRHAVPHVTRHRDGDAAAGVPSRRGSSPRGLRGLIRSRRA